MSDDDPYHIEIANRQHFDCVDPHILNLGIREALRRFHAPSAEISVAIVTDEQIARVHEKYLGIAGPTDVLSFDLSDPPGAADAALQGEVMISAETALRRASGQHHPASSEVALYAVHGVLHLLGMDDHDDDDAREMHRLEDEILNAIGVGEVYGSG